MTTVGQSALDTLSAMFAGELIGASDARYDEARSVFNAMIDRRPEVVARCSGVADVRAALRWGRDAGVPIAVRSGGHSVPGYAVCDDGVVIDLSPMRGVRVDRARRTARVQAGATWGHVDRETQEFALAVTGGRVSTTGVGGLTLGSGSGWLERMFGLTCDNLISADVVTAEGDVVRASADENDDLFWGLRGGGGNFGIVTDFEFQLHEVGPLVLGGLLAWPIDQAPDAFRFYRDFIAAAPREVGGGAALITAPPEEFVPEAARGQKVFAVIVFHHGDLKKGEDAFRPLREFGPPALDMISPMPYTAMQQIVDAPNQAGFFNYWKAEFLPTLTDGAIDTFIEHAGRATSPLTSLLVMPFGGAAGEVPDDATALGNRTAEWNFHAIGMWADPSTSDENIEWARDLSTAMQPHSMAGVFLNFIGDEGQDRVRSTFGERYDRLVAVKDRWDPDNVFRLNQNIAPSTAVQPATAAASRS